MNRANLVAIEKRITAAEIVTRQQRGGLVILHRRDGLTPAELTQWEAENADAIASADIAIVIRRMSDD